MFRHLSMISIQESYSNKEEMPEYLLGVLFVVFVNFAVEIYVEREFGQLVRGYAKSLEYAVEGS